MDLEIKDKEDAKSIDDIIKEMEANVNITFTPEPLFVFAVILTFGLIVALVALIFGVII